MSHDDRLTTCDHRLGFDLMFTGDGETLRCPDCRRVWVAVHNSDGSGS